MAVAEYHLSACGGVSPPSASPLSESPTNKPAPVALEHEDNGSCR